MGIAAGLIAVLAASVSLAPLAVAQNGRPIAVTPPGGAPVSFADLIERVSPAVVSVQVTTEMKATERNSAFNPFRGLPGFDEYEDEFGEESEPSPDEGREGEALGSGFFISAAGYIIFARGARLMMTHPVYAPADVAISCLTPQCMGSGPKATFELRAPSGQYGPGRWFFGQNQNISGGTHLLSI
jgi:hypothetical protein